MIRYFMMLLMVATLLVTAGVTAAETLIKGAGATFPHLLYSEWFSEFSSIHPGVKFSYQPLGSGEGIKAILEDKVDFGASGKPLSDEERKKASGKILEIPMVLGAAVVAYNLPNVTGTLKLTPDVLASIFLGEITRWNDPRIAAVNKDIPSIPDQPVFVVHRADASGTTSIFTEYLSQVSGTWAGSIGKGALVKWPVGIGENGNGGVARKIKSMPWSIGYIELSYAHGLGLAFAAIKNRDGYYVEPNTASIKAAGRHLREKDASDGKISLVNRTGRDVYPICGVTWLLVHARQKDHQKGEILVNFIKWCLGRGQQLALDLHFVPLPDNLRDRSLKLVDTVRY